MSEKHKKKIIIYENKSKVCIVFEKVKRDRVFLQIVLVQRKQSLNAPQQQPKVQWNKQQNAPQQLT